MLSKSKRQITALIVVLWEEHKEGNISEVQEICDLLEGLGFLYLVAAYNNYCKVEENIINASYLSEENKKMLIEQITEDIIHSACNSIK